MSSCRTLSSSSVEIRTMPSSTVGCGTGTSDTGTPSGRLKWIVTVPESRPPMEVGVPLATISALKRTATLSASASTSSM